MNNVRGLYPPLYGAPANGGGGGGGSIQVDTLPEASLEYKDKIVQYTGATTETLTNGYFYKCIEHTETEGETITVTYSWDNVDVMYVPAPTVSIDIPTNGAVKVGTVAGEDLYATCIVNPENGYNNAQWIMDLHIKDIYNAWGTAVIDGVNHARPVNDQSDFKLAQVYFVDVNGLYITYSGSGWHIGKLIVLFTKTS